MIFCPDGASESCVKLVASDISSLWDEYNFKHLSFHKWNNENINFALYMSYCKAQYAPEGQYIVVSRVIVMINLLRKGKSSICDLKNNWPAYLNWIVLNKIFLDSKIMSP